MPTLTGKPEATKYQVGEEVFFMLDTKLLSSGFIKKIESLMANPADNSDGVQTNYYYIGTINKAFSESELFATKNLLFVALNNGEELDIISGLEIADTDLNGKDWSGLDLTGVDLSAIAVANLGGLDIKGAKLTDAVFHEDIESKADLIAAVGAGKYDNKTTYTDGTLLTEE